MSANHSIGVALTETTISRGRYSLCRDIAMVIKAATTVSAHNTKQCNRKATDRNNRINILRNVLTSGTRYMAMARETLRQCHRLKK
jgi:hypothetical protein